MELRLHHIIEHLYNIFLENGGSENCAQLLEEEVNKMFSTKYLNDEHGCNVVSMNSLNIHDANDMQSHKLGDAMFLMNMIFLVPQVLMSEFIMMIACLLFMMIIMMKVDLERSWLYLVLNLDEASIDYDNKAVIYDDYGHDMYALKNNDIH